MRTKPRSAIRTVEWLHTFVAVTAGRDWDERAEDGKSRVARAAYVAAAHPDLDASRAGDIESNARQDKSLFESLGLAYQERDSGIIRITPAGRELSSTDYPDEVMLRQLLKWQFPSYTHGDGAFARMNVFPFEVLLRVLERLVEVNRLEIAATFFTCLSRDDIPSAIENILAVRRMRKLTSEHVTTHAKRVIAELHPDLARPSAASLLDMADAFSRFAEYTGIVQSSGRSIYTKLSVPGRSHLKFGQLLSDYPFELRADTNDQAAFYEYFGDPSAVELPWDRAESLAEHVRRRAEALRQIAAERDAAAPQLALKIDPNEVLQSVDDAEYAELREWNRRLERGLIGAREQRFVEHEAKTPKMREEILAKFDDILNGSEDDAARWLEVNTWRSLVALDGDHTVERNFKLEEDLTPRAFAPGAGNTPDMKYSSPRIVLIPEVSLQSGVRQWTNEGASVVDHVFRFINEHSDDARPVIGLFIAPTLNERTAWQFFVLNQQSWRGEPVPVVPFEVDAWTDLLSHAYQRDLPARSVEELIFHLHRAVLSSRNFKDWLRKMKLTIETWKADRLPTGDLSEPSQSALPLNF